MKKYFYFLFLFSLICSSELKSKDTNLGNTFVNTYAVIVAVADYKYFEPGEGGDLDFTTNDAQKFYRFLISPSEGKVPAHHISLLLNEKANKANVLYQMERIFAKAGPKDRIIFYYSGHGVPGNIIPYDGKGQEQLIPFEDIKAQFKKSQAGTKLCILDACNANSIKMSTKTSSARLGQKKSQPATTSNSTKKAEIAVMVSSQSYQNSIEDKALQQGVFSYFLIHGLRGAADKNKDNIITMTELHAFVYQSVKVYTQNRQVPHTFGRFNEHMVVAVLN